MGIDSDLFVRGEYYRFKIARGYTVNLKAATTVTVI